MLKTMAGRALLSGLLLLSILSAELPAQQDRYEEESGIPAKAQDLFNKAQRLEQSGKAEEAVKTYENVIRIEPTYAEAYQQMGLAYAGLNRYPDAVKAFQEVIRLRPQSSLAQGNLGAAYMKMGRFSEARNAFREAVRLSPEDGEAHYNLGVALGKLNRDQEALGEFAQAVKLQPNLARAHRNLGLANLNLNRLDEARKSLQEAAALDPKDPQVHYALCVYYARTGDVAAANKEFKTLQGLNKDLAQKLKEQIKK